jgi:hypothetical protein
MPERKYQGIVGPLLLILIGVALLLNQLGLLVWDWTNVLRLWPLLLILVGLEILFGRTGWGRLLVGGLAILAIVAAVALGGPALKGVAQPVQDKFDYPATGVKAATMRFDLGVAELDLAALPETAQLFEAEVRYDREHSQIARSVDVRNGVAEVLLKTTRQGGLNLSQSSFNEAWRVRLNREIPTRLEINTGINQAHLDLRGLDITGLSVKAGIGEVQVTLAEKGAYEATLNGGIGSLVIEVPAEVEARIRAEAGLGSVNVSNRFVRQGQYYETPGYGAAKNRVEVTAKGGIGSLTVR